MWILFGLLYGVFCGLYNVSQKQMLKKTDPFVAIVLCTTVSFLLISWRIGSVFPMDGEYILLLICKSLIMSFCWTFMVLALEKLEVTKTTLLTSLSVVFTFISGIVFFKETISIFQLLGAVIVLIGIVFIATDKNKQTNEFKEIQLVVQKSRKEQFLPILYAILVALTGSISSLFDKILMQHITVTQMQFCYFLFALVFLWIGLGIKTLIKKEILIKKIDFKNIWIYLAGAILIISDACLFKAYSIDGSMLSVIPVLGKMSLVVTFVCGILFLKEDRSPKRFLYFGIVLTGVILSAF